jgi:hypothetical protein
MREAADLKVPAVDVLNTSDRIVHGFDYRRKWFSLYEQPRPDTVDCLAGQFLVAPGHPRENVGDAGSGRSTDRGDTRSAVTRTTGLKTGATTARPSAVCWSEDRCYIRQPSPNLPV